MNPWAVAVVLLVSACSVHAQGTFKCQDKDGRIVYVDRACQVYGLREIGPVKDRMNVALPPPPAGSEKDVPAPDAQPARPEIPASENRRDAARERAIARCKKNHGADCVSEEGLGEWLRQDKPITDEERQAAVVQRRLRELCLKSNGTAPECADLQTDP